VCAGEGWTKECTQRVFRHNARVRDQLNQIEHDRNLLETEYSHSVAGAGLLPQNQEIRLPTGLGLEYKKAESSAELGVCKLAPKDMACIAARREEVETVKVLHAELTKVVGKLTDLSHGLVGDIQQPKADVEQHVEVVRKLAELIHRQNAPDMLSQEGWRTLNAVSAVVLKQTLGRVEEESNVAFHDILLHHASPHILYIGAFKGLMFHGLGCLYRKDGTLAYLGSWLDGLMDGEGTLLNHKGETLWKGLFSAGSPSRPWYSL